MATTRPSKVIDGTFGLIAKRLRDDGAGVTQEVLPERWVDLILYLDQQERRSVTRPNGGDAPK